MDQVKPIRKQVYRSKIFIRRFSDLIAKLYLVKSGSETSIEFHIISIKYNFFHYKEETLDFCFINGEIELFFDFLLSNETYFEYRNSKINRLICAEKVTADPDIFSLYIGHYNDFHECLDILELETKHEFLCLLKKLKWLTNKITSLREEHKVTMYDKESAVYINSNGTMLDLEELKRNKICYEDIKLRKNGKVN